jgi:hypothetical protein
MATKQDISPAKDNLAKPKVLADIVANDLITKVASAKNKVIKQMLDKKKTVKDTKGDVWELTEKRDKV